MSCSWKFKFTAKDSIINVSIGHFDGFEILGTSFPLGVRVGVVSWTPGFVIRLPGGLDGGIVVVRALSRSGGMRDTKTIHVIRQNQRRVTAYEDPVNPAEMIGSRHLFHVYDGHAEVDLGGTIVSSGEGAFPTDGLRADMSSILAFVAGSITKRDLLKAASGIRKEEAAAAKAERLEGENKRFRRALALARSRVAGSAEQLGRIGLGLEEIEAA